MVLSAACVAPLLLALASAAVYKDSPRPGFFGCKLDDKACWKSFLQNVMAENFNTAPVFPSCGLSSSDCIKNFLQNDIIGHFSEGFPDAGVKSLDPLHYDDLTYTYEIGVGTKFEITHTDRIFYGLAKSKVVDFKSKVTGSKYSVEASISIPKVLYEGSYTCEGDWMLWPFSWKGRFNMSMGGYKDTWKLEADLVKKGDQTFLELQDVSFEPEVTTFSTYASGLFGDMPELGNFALAMTNAYWRNFFDVMWTLAKPQAFSEAKEHINLIFSKIPVTV